MGTGISGEPPRNPVPGASRGPVRDHQLGRRSVHRYNCIAWAAGAVGQWWWPGDPAATYWPAGVSRVETVTAFREAFAILGYAPCNSADLEPGVEKVAVFAEAAGIPTHAARQLPSGRWTSKLGRLQDIEHALVDISGSAYGTVVLLMGRSTGG